jgi:hypothetical protein
MERAEIEKVTTAVEIAAVLAEREPQIKIFSVSLRHW